MEMRPLRHIVIAHLMILCLLAGVSPGASVEPAEDKGSPDLTVDYRIGPADRLSVIVYRNVELSVEVPVLPDGKISVPLVGSIQAAGKSTDELEEIITKKLGEYITEPNVTVVVTEVNSFIVYVIGEVTRPGAQLIPRRTTVLQALSSAGGFTQFADKGDINVLRHRGGKEIRMPFNYKEVTRGERLEQNVTLEPGDVIVVSD